MIKKILWSVLILLIVVVVWQRELLSYGLDQAKGQLKVIREARPVEEFLLDPDFPDSLKQKIILAQEVRKFAMEHLGLNQSDNYTKMFDQKGKTILWNVSACAPYQLDPYKWQFPFLGSMPYKGYFDLEKAKEEAERLSKEGLDTRIQQVSGWSTLGILSDPILSNMLHRSDGALAELIIHELTHSTIFIKNEIEFNENLASFIGERGAELFLLQRFGDSSSQQINYKYALSDQRKLTKHILSGAVMLDSLYGQMENLDDEIKKEVKKNAIAQIVENLDTVSFFHDRYHQIFSETHPNNAYFMAFMRYQSQEDTLTTIYSQYNNDLVEMIEALKEQHAK
jgi:predicted aminopeptidase